MGEATDIKTGLIGIAILFVILIVLYAACDAAGVFDADDPYTYADCMRDFRAEGALTEGEMREYCARYP